MTNYRHLFFSTILASSVSAFGFAGYVAAQDAEQPPASLGIDAPYQGKQDAVSFIPPLDAIAIEETSALTYESEGLETPQSQGFSNDIWRESSQESLVNLLQKLPQGIDNASMRQLLTLLLSFRTQGPEKESDDENWLTLRARTLAHIGEIDKALTLLTLLPKEQRSAEHRIMQMGYALQTGNSKKACDQVRATPDIAASVGGSAAFLPSVCHAIDGNQAKASLQTSLLSESNLLAPWMERWLKAYHITSPKAANNAAAFYFSDDNDDALSESSDAYDAIQYGLLRYLLPGVWPKEYRSLVGIEELPLALQRAVLEDPKLSDLLDKKDALRLAESLFTVGALPKELLFERYATYHGGGFTQHADLSSTTAFRGADGHAALYGQLIATTQLTKQSAILRKFFEVAHKETRIPLMQSLFGDVIEQMSEKIKPDTPYLEIAPIALIHALSNTDPVQATRWANHLEQHRSSHALLPLGKAMIGFLKARISGDAETSRYEAITLTLPAPNIIADRDERQLMAQLYTLLSASGLAVDDALMAGETVASDAGTMLHPLMLPLRRAIEEQRKGPVILYMISILQETPLASMHPKMAADLVNAMHAIGYDSWADSMLMQALAADLMALYAAPSDG